MSEKVSLYDLLNEILVKESLIYYLHHSNKLYCDIDEMLTSERKCSNFIIDYFRQGGKATFIDEQISYPLHVFTVYLLGYLVAEKSELAQSIESYYGNLYNLKNKNVVRNEFSYYWFLCALYHDQGYYYEDKNKYPELSEFVQKEMFMDKIMFSNITYQFQNKTSRYSDNLYRRYFHFSKEERNVIEHGYVGGQLLFHRSKKNLETVIDHVRHLYGYVNIESFVFDNLHWSKKQLEVFRSIAFVIMEHNIWKQEDLEISRRYGLNEITNEAFKKISAYKQPLLFLLCLVDNLDIYKHLQKSGKYSKETYLKILKKIKVEIIDNEIEMFFCENLISTMNDYIENIKDLENWMKINIEVKDSSVTLRW